MSRTNSPGIGARARQHGNAAIALSLAALAAHAH
jgi:hypothetical protein